MHAVISVRPGIRLRSRQQNRLSRFLFSRQGNIKSPGWFGIMPAVVLIVAGFNLTSVGMVQPPPARPAPQSSETSSGLAEQIYAQHVAEEAVHPHVFVVDVPQDVIPPDPGGPLMAGTVDLKVPFFWQTYNLSCEEAALQMALAYRGFKVTQEQILAEIGVDWDHPSAGVSKGGNPWTSFVGNYNGSEVAATGYGTYWPTIASVAGKRVAVVRAGQGISPDELYTKIRQAHVAVVWVTFSWSYVPAWTYTTWDGQTAPYAGPIEHAVTVAGVSDGQVLINDPDRGPAWIDKSVFEGAYATYGDMAVIL